MPVYWQYYYTGRTFQELNNHYIYPFYEISYHYHQVPSHTGGALIVIRAFMGWMIYVLHDLSLTGVLFNMDREVLDVTLKCLLPKRLPIFSKKIIYSLYGTISSELSTV